MSFIRIDSNGTTYTLPTFDGSTSRDDSSGHALRYLIQKLEQEIAARQEFLGGGNIEDMAAYKQITGQIWAWKYAIQEIKDLAKKLGEHVDD